MRKHRRHKQPKVRYVFFCDASSTIHIAEAFQRKRFRCVAASVTVDDMQPDEWDDRLSEGYEERVRGVINNVHGTRASG